MKVAIVHEYITKLGGAERVLESLLEIYPEADVLCLLYDESITRSKYPGVNFIGSGIQKWPKFIRNFFRFFMGRLCVEVEQFDLSGYELVISSSNSFAHGVITPTEVPHIVYYHSPARFLWDWKNEYLLEKGWVGWKKILVDWVRKPIREWDYMAAQRSDVVIANSDNVRKRVKKFYKRDSLVVFPPVDVERFKSSNDVEDYYLIVSTLSRYKRIDLAVESFKLNGKKLKIVGTGDDRENLEAISKGCTNIEFLGFKSDEDVAMIMSKCKGLIFCSEEDFGITPVEVMASGRPVFGYGKGGLLETVKNGVTGRFFYEQEIDVFLDELEKFEKWVETDFDSNKARIWAENFRKEIFKEKIKEVVNRETKK
jgi:glycosyltransferase involved in cell wall biosynthesis